MVYIYYGMYRKNLREIFLNNLDNVPITFLVENLFIENAVVQIFGFGEISPIVFLVAQKI